LKLSKITATRLKLRPLTYDDTEDIFEIFSDAEVTRYWGHDTLQKREEARDFIEKTISGAKDGSLLEWGIIEKETQHLIGVCAFAGWNREHRRAELGFALHKDYWGKKYMSELLPVFISYGFKELKLHRIEADVDPRNLASIKLLEKFGFQKEGYLRECYHINGEIQDALFYGLLEKDFSS